MVEFNLNEYLESFLNQPSDVHETIEIDISKEMHYIDDRYKAENKLLEQIALGNEQGAFNAFMEYGKLMQSPMQVAKPTSGDSVRDFKNSVSTMNTLFRKAVENNHVHPIYIHEYSSMFGTKIEETETFEGLVDIISQMVKRYCHLSRHYSLATYSKTVREAILYIDINFCSPLSTKDVANALFLSPNYLSAQFNEEFGRTITEYIKERRIHRAKKLLLSTKLSVQDIAAAVGIYDVCYFSRQFKNSVGLSPLQFQKQNRSPKQ